MTREELAVEMETFVDYCKGVERADGFNIMMVETVLGTFATWLRGRSELATNNTKEDK